MNEQKKEYCKPEINIVEMGREKELLLCCSEPCSENEIEYVN